MATIRALVIEDDADIRELLVFSLAKEGWEPIEAQDGEKGLALAARQRPDIVILDIMLPGMDGLAVLRKLKACPSLSRVPVILASAKGEEADVVAGLELGADDYVVKPFSPKVLAARIRAALRRSREEDGPAIAENLEHGPFALDAVRHEFFAAGRTIDLSATEFAMLRILLGEPGRVFTRTQIIDAVKGADYPVTDRAVDVQILSIRRKLGDEGSWIETVRGVGYKMRD